MRPKQSNTVDERILVEQVRLLLSNVKSSVIPTFVVSLLLTWIMFRESNALILTIWCICVMSSKLYSAWAARRVLASELGFVHAQRIVWLLMVLNAVDGAAWGALVWISLDSVSFFGSILAALVLAGIFGSAMSLMSPIFPVFVIFSVFCLATVASKLWLLDNSTYTTMGLASLLYVASLLGQARNNAMAARRSIAASLENKALIEHLRIEIDQALAAHQVVEQANLAKSRFLAAASHDLRQPIHAQGLFLELLVRSELSAIQREVLDSARAAHQASTEMLNTLLDFSRIEAGALKPRIQRFALQPLLNKIENEMALQANTKGLVYRTRETRAIIESDPVLIELILRNLVTNAIRYTEKGGVLVACRSGSNTASLEVWDTGIGIAPDQQQEIFREFHQLANPERDRHQGLGLGLAIIDKLARTLEHDLTLNSCLQRGSVFKLTLPLAGPGLR